VTSVRVAKIRAVLEATFAPQELDIIDDSHRHAGHAGAKDGRGHFRVRIVSQSFAGTRSLQRHRMVYAALGELMRTDIHALSVDALSPDDRRDSSPQV
jgi:BolA family transcriptional regulator, general stress-responsive regulator